MNTVSPFHVSLPQLKKCLKGERTLKKRFTNPLLPQKKAAVAVSSEAQSVINSLKSNGFTVFEIAKNPKLEPSIASHADCNLQKLDESTYFVDKSNYDNIKAFFYAYPIVNNLTNCFLLNLELVEICSPYPYEASINVKRIEGGIVCNIKCVDNKIKEYAVENGLQLYHCNQGYVGCSTVLVAPKAIMTDDKSIYDCFNSIGFDCLMLSKGQIKLSGHQYGFIGGCCGFVDKNLLAFTGRISSHKDSERIKNFLSKYNIKALELTDDALTDIGGIVPIL